MTTDPREAARMRHNELLQRWVRPAKVVAVVGVLMRRRHRANLRRLGARP